MSEKDEKPSGQTLSSFILNYLCTPHATNNRAPCELFVSRQLRTQLDLLDRSNRTMFNTCKASKNESMTVMQVNTAGTWENG